MFGKVSFLLTITCLLQCLSLMAQTSIVDSLKSQLEKPLTDSAVIMVKSELAREYIYVDIQKANDLATEALALAEDKDLEYEKAHAMRVMGAVLSNNGFYVNGAELLLQSRTIFRRYNDKLGEANINISLAHLYDNLGDSYQSLNFSKSALRLLLLNPVKERLGIVYNNLGRSYNDSNQLDSAEYFTKMSIEVNKEIDNIPLLQSNYRNMGIILFNKAAYDSAIYYSNKVLQIDKELGEYSNTWAVAESHLTQAKVALIRNRFEKVPAHLNEAQDFAAQYGYLNILLEVMKVSFNFYNIIGDYEMLEKSWDEYLILSDSAAKIDKRSKRQIVEWYEDRLVSDSEMREAKIKVAEKENQIVRLAIIIVFVFAVLFLLLFLYTKINKTNRQLDDQKKKLEKLNNTKTKLFSIIAHDFRSPLAQISGFSNLLSEHIDNLDPKELKSMASQMNDSVNNTIAMTENLLAWARNQMEGSSSQPILIDLKDIFEQLKGLLIPQAEEKNISLNFQMEDSIMVKADPEEITVIFRNLITNAIKFTPAGKAVNILLQKSGSHAKVKVIDEGIGMDEKTKTELFDLSNKTSRKGTAGELGTGLGLLLCKEFVDKTGGKIEVESTPDVGSVFKVFLPLAK